MRKVGSLQTGINQAMYGRFTLSHQNANSFALDPQRFGPPMGVVCVSRYQYIMLVSKKSHRPNANPNARPNASIWNIMVLLGKFVFGRCRFHLVCAILQSVGYSMQTQFLVEFELFSLIKVRGGGG